MSNSKIIHFVAYSLLLAITTAFSTFAYNELTKTVIITILKPQADSVVNELLTIEVDIQSTYELDTVIAEVANRSTTLVFNSDLGSFIGEISLLGLERGEQILTVTATDIFGASAQNELHFTFDLIPILTIEFPVAHSVARPDIDIRANCQDDDPEGCSRIQISVWGSVITSSLNTLDGVISLDNYDGSSILLSFEACDSLNQWTSETRRIYVESSARLDEIESVNGKIWDIDSQRILFLDEKGETSILKILDRATSQEIIVVTDPIIKPKYGFLTPNGAIFLYYSGHNPRIYDWQNGVLVDVGHGTTALKVAGRYAIWSVDTTLYLRDLLNAETVQVSSNNVGNCENDIAENGVVVFWGGSYDIYVYQDESINQLTNDSYYWNTYPLTDGDHFVYRKHDPCCGSQLYSIVLYENSNEVILSPERSSEPYPDRDYALNNGWIVFDKTSTSGQLQLWRRSPEGEDNQITFYGTSSFIDSVGPDGTVT